MQLNKYLALCGFASRRKANLFIAEKRVRVNGKVIDYFGFVVNPEEDRIEVDRKVVRLPEKPVYVLLNKPAGVITTAEDPRGRKTVLDLVSVQERIFPVGRLDLDTEGVLLLTNDGYLTHRLAHPKFEIEKVYMARVRGQMDQIAVTKLKSGVFINPGVRVNGEVQVIKKERDQTLIEIRIHEGKKRQIKRMMKAVGHPVIYLRRTCFAGLTVKGLARGNWRELKEKEICSLYHAAGLKWMKDS